MIWFQYQPFKVTRKYHKISRNFSKTEISAFQQHAFDIQYYYIIPRIILVGIPLLCELANFLRLSFLLNVITSMKLTKLTETLNSYQYNFFVHDIRCEFSLIFQVCKKHTEYNHDSILLSFHRSVFQFSQYHVVTKHF